MSVVRIQLMGCFTGRYKWMENYQTQAKEALEGLQIDWSEVFRAISDRLYDDREWAGQINIIKGKAHVVELVPTPCAVEGGESPQRNQSNCPCRKI